MQGARRGPSVGSAGGERHREVAEPPDVVVAEPDPVVGAAEGVEALLPEEPEPLPVAAVSPEVPEPPEAPDPPADPEPEAVPASPEAPERESVR